MRGVIASCRRQSWPRTVALLHGFLLLVVTGCGGASADARLAVQGTVTLDGEPLPAGVILFAPEGAATDKRVKTGGNIVNGKYAIKAGKGPNPGLCRVEITWMKKTGRKLPSNEPLGPPVDEKIQVLPAKYHTQSTLTAEIKSDSTTFNFDLKSK